MKRVDFSDESDMAPIPDWYSHQMESVVYQEELWWTRREMHNLRCDAGNIVDAVMDGCDVVWARADRTSYCRTVAELHRACVHETLVASSVQEDLGFWSSVGHSRRGLEFHIVEEIQSCRLQRREHLLEAVRVAQEKCEEDNLTADQADRLLRNASEIVSKPAKLFAYHMAASDFSAVQADYQLLQKQKRRKRKLCRKRFSNTKKHVSTADDVYLPLNQVRVNPAAA